MMAKQEEVRKRIYEFYLNNKLQGKKFTVAHFNAEIIPRSTIYDIIKRVENDSGYKRVQGSGRVAKIKTPKGIKRLKIIFDHSDQVSMRQAGRKYGYSPSHIIKTLAKYTDIKSYKKQGIPHRQENQNERIKTGIDRLYRDLKENRSSLTTSLTLRCHTQQLMETAPTTLATETRLHKVLNIAKSASSNSRCLSGWPLLTKVFQSHFLSPVALQSIKPSMKLIV